LGKPAAIATVLSAGLINEVEKKRINGKGLKGKRSSLGHYLVGGCPCRGRGVADFLTEGDQVGQAVFRRRRGRGRTALNKDIL